MRVLDRGRARSGSAIGHTAAQDEDVHLLQEILDDGDLGRDLRTAQDGAERALRVKHNAVDGLQLVLHHIAEHQVLKR